MNVLEIKNNLVKISCEANDKLLLAGFVIIENIFSIMWLYSRVF